MRVRRAIGSKPLLVKIGHVTDETAATSLCKALEPHVDALAMVNCIAAAIVDEKQRPLFNSDRRGIAGKAIRNAVIDQVRQFSKIIRRDSLKLSIVGVGGIATAEDVREHLDAGGHAVQLATATMLDPFVGIKIRERLASLR